jgi:hypothetical protein
MALRLLIAILILAVPLELPGCGPFLPESLFFAIRQPEAPADFARGRLGILQPTYDRLYQVVAYRYLAGVGLNDAERQAVLPPPDVSAPAWPPNPWLEARNRVPGVKMLRQIDTYRQVQRKDYFGMYLNCNDDAFLTAASTLERIRHTGAVTDWIAAQDVVFADCSKGADMPQPTSDPRLAADRAYQFASAKFYSEQYDAARQDFQTIAADASSPWRGIAPYLAARCLIRAGRFGQAEGELQHIAADPALAHWHAPANALLGYVRVRLHPAERMHDMALALVRPEAQGAIGQNLTDYRLLFDQDVKPQPTDDLTDWIRSFQAGGSGALEHWRAHPTLPWLVAALEASSPRGAALPELLAAAREVKPDSPAYITVNYHSVRLLPADDARALAEQLLAGDMPVSARNQFRAQRMRLARDFQEFLRYAPRTPVDNDTTTPGDELDGDSALLLDRAIPLSLLQQAADSTLMPDDARAQLAEVISIRTLLLAPSPNFDRVFQLLNTPGDGPFVRGGYGRYTRDPKEKDPFRDNWWCTSQPPQSSQQTQQQPAPPAPFLSAADRQQAAAEWQKLTAIPTAPDWLAAQTLAFAQAHPQDPRVPEALYLAVRATRFGCTDAETGDYSRRAFQLLHRRYPDSDWAAKTPYWFK